VSPVSSPRKGLFNTSVQTSVVDDRYSLDGKEAGDVVKLRLEREQLAANVRQIEADLEKLRVDVRMLSSDRDNFKLLYEQSNDEVRRLRHELSHKIGTAPLRQATTHTIIRQIERERDEAQDEIRRLQLERDSLQDRLKISTETEKASRDVLEQKAVRAEVDLKDVVIERDELVSRVRSLRDMVSHLEDQIKSTSASLSASRHQTTEMESRVEEMRALADQAETARQEQARLLKKCQLDLEAADQRIRDKDANIGSLEEMLKASREEASRLQEALHSLDRQRDTVQDELDVKTETLFQMKKEKQLQVETEQHLQANIRELHSQLSARENLILSKDQEISSLRHQLDASSAQFKEACHGREIAIADNRRLQRDLKTMTQENQVSIVL
jgi:centrosomal protein CEP135